MNNTLAPARFAKKLKMANPCDPTSATITKIRSKCSKPSLRKTQRRHNMARALVPRVVVAACGVQAPYHARAPPPIAEPRVKLSNVSTRNMELTMAKL